MLSDDSKKTESVYIQQNQDGQIFKLPIAIDIYGGGKKERHKVWLNSKADTLTFTLSAKPDLVNIDADKVLLALKTDNKTHEEFNFQYFNAPLYHDRFEAINDAAGHQSAAVEHHDFLQRRQRYQGTADFRFAGQYSYDQ